MVLNYQFEIHWSRLFLKSDILHSNPTSKQKSLQIWHTKKNFPYPKFSIKRTNHDSPPHQISPQPQSILVTEYWDRSLIYLMMSKAARLSQVYHIFHRALPILQMLSDAIWLPLTHYWSSSLVKWWVHSQGTWSYLKYLFHNKIKHALWKSTSLPLTDSLCQLHFQCQ